MKYTSQQRDGAIADLRRLLKPGSLVYTILRHVSSSGMTRDISLYAVKPDGINNITVSAAYAMNSTLRQEHDFAIRTGGCGMDMGYYLVYNLGRTLYPEGFNCPEYKRGPFFCPEDGNRYRTIGDRKDVAFRCPGNDHVNYRRAWQNTVTIPYHHRDGGYALNHTWL